MKNRFLIIVVSLISLLSISGCASNSVEKPELNKVYVTNTNRVDLLPVNAISREIEQYQLFEGRFGNQSITATIFLQADSSGIDIMLLNDFGIEMGNISYDGISASINSELFPKKLKPEYILLDLQNAYADYENLKNHYSKYGLTFEENAEFCINPEGSSEPYYCFVTRTLSKKGKKIETIEINLESPEKVVITNHLRGYVYKLTSAE